MLFELSRWRLARKELLGAKERAFGWRRASHWRSRLGAIAGGYGQAKQIRRDGARKTVGDERDRRINSARTFGLAVVVFLSHTTSKS